MADMISTKKLVLFGPANALQEFKRPDFLHQDFFIHCSTRDELRTTIITHANANCEMDIFLPDTAVDLIGYYDNTVQLRKKFFLYCDTDNSVNRYENMMQPGKCYVFNANEIEERLYDIAGMHLLHYLNNLKKLSKKGDVDADDMCVVIGELFEQCATTINEYIRQRSCLPVQPMEHEEE